MKKKGFYKVYPKEDAIYDAELYNKEKKNCSNIVYVDYMYHTKHTKWRIMRGLSLILVIVSFVVLSYLTYLLNKISPESVTGDEFLSSLLTTSGFILGLVSILITSVVFFISFNFNYNDHQKTVYDYYFKKHANI